MSDPKGIVLVTGIKVRQSHHTFTHPTAAQPIEVNNVHYKVNTAAGVAIEVTKAGYCVHMAGFSEFDLRLVGDQMTGLLFSSEVVDPLHQEDVERLAATVRALQKRHNVPVSIVHYGGASTTAQSLPHDTVFLSLDKIPFEAPANLVRDNVETFLRLYAAMRDLLYEQKVSKVISITSLASWRCKTEFALDALQKGAMHNLLRCAALEETKRGVYITEIMPGITDTGYYDKNETLACSLRQAQELGYRWTEDDFPLYRPEHIGMQVVHVLESPFYIPIMPSMPFGQYPHLGA